MKHYHGKYQSSTRARPFFWVGLGCCLAAAGFFVYLGLFFLGAVRQRQENARAAKTYVQEAPAKTAPAAAVKSATEAAAEQATQEAPEPARAEQPEAPSTEAPTEPRFPTVDFQGLWEKNPQVVAWLQIPAMESINYPVVLGPDNAYYAHHSWEGTESDHGAIFLDYGNTADFSQVHSILYGHCMKDGTMFQPLGKWEGPEYFANTDRTLLLFLPGKTRVYEIFAVERVNALDSRVYKTDYASDSAWSAALAKTLQTASVKSEQVLTQDSRVLTLSTCMGDMERLVVHALCIEEILLP